MTVLPQIPGILGKIVAHKQQQVKGFRQANQYQQASFTHQQPNLFTTTLQQANTGVIAEIKFQSPSAGTIRVEKNTAWIAREYANNGAVCLSVLTEEHWFGGAIENMRIAKSASGLPILNKDFVISSEQIIRALENGADAILLIVAILNDQALLELSELALGLGLSVLVEVHSEEELTRALICDERCMIGINNRNLKTMTTDLQTTIDLARKIPSNRLLVSESGIGSAADIKRIKSHQIHCFLIGESLMKQPNPGTALAQLLAD